MNIAIGILLTIFSLSFLGGGIFMGVFLWAVSQDSVGGKNSPKAKVARRQANILLVLCLLFGLAVSAYIFNWAWYFFYK